MNYIGIDIHKKYSVLCAQDERGWTLRESRIEGNSTDGFVQFFQGFEGPSKAVLEACWNWASRTICSKRSKRSKKWCWPIRSRRG
jgi:transposase